MNWRGKKTTKGWPNKKTQRKKGGKHKNCPKRTTGRVCTWNKKAVRKKEVRANERREDMPKRSLHADGKTKGGVKMKNQQGSSLIKKKEKSWTVCQELGGKTKTRPTTKKKGAGRGGEKKRTLEKEKKTPRLNPKKENMPRTWTYKNWKSHAVKNGKSWGYNMCGETIKFAKHDQT